MRRVRIPPLVVAAVVVCSAVIVWLVVKGLPTYPGTAPLKRTPSNVPVAVAFTPQEYTQFRAECPPEFRDPLREYLWQALRAGREVEAIRAVEPENAYYAWEHVTFDLIGQAGSSQWPKDEKKHGPAVRRLREVRPHAVRPFAVIIDGFLLFCDGRFEQAEEVFAALPTGYERDTLWMCRLTGLQHRGLWREAYQTLEPQRKVFHVLGYRFLNEKSKTDEYEELIRLHRAADPDDLLLTYHTAYLRYQQQRYDEVLEPSAEYLRRSQMEWDHRLPPGFSQLDMRHLHAFSLVMLDRFVEAEAFSEQFTMKHTGGEITHPRDRVRLAMALRRGDADGVEKLLASGPDAIWLAHNDEHLAPLFWGERFAELREKYPPDK